MKYKELFERLFKKSDMEELIDEIEYDYIETMFDDKELTFEIMIKFIEKHEQDIIASALNDEELVYNLLREKAVVDTTKKHLITKEYLENLITKIKNGAFDLKSLTLYLYIMQIRNLCIGKYDDTSIKEILDANILSIVENERLASEDGDTILSKEQKQEVTDKLLSWNKKCGKEVLPYIFMFETLKNNITTLMNSPQVNQDYKIQLSVLLKLCDYSILVRDNDITPTPEEINLINNLFNEYESINKAIILDTLETEDILLVHFIRDNDVDYQLRGNQIVDMAGKTNNSFDDNQSDFFIQSYYEFTVSQIEEQTGQRFDINNPDMRKRLEEALGQYNYIINNKPLDKLPIKKRETSYNFTDYIRETDWRRSCSFISKNNPTSHLNRKIGLILRPKNKKAILSTSIGYTSEKGFRDYRNDSVPCTELFKTLDDRTSVNETCVDASECEIVGVLLLSDKKEVVEKAQRIADVYNVEVINLNNQIKKH